MRQELDAAGITDPALMAAYGECRRLNAKHGRTYYLATLLLPPPKRPFVHALYGFARYADDIVDAPAAGGAAERGARLDRLREDLTRELAGRTLSVPSPVVRAVADTARRWQLDSTLFIAFLDSMAMDLTIGSYDTYDDLRRYMYGSAAVIGLQMLPILEPCDLAAAEPGAIALGEAFQLANFIRDVPEDLDRGRIYLPLAELARHGVTPATLMTRRTDDALRGALAEQVERVRRLSERAEPAIGLLHPSVRDCIETARILYCGIADEVERQDYDVFAMRATVPRTHRARVAGRAWVRARRARRRNGPGTVPAGAVTGGATSADR